MAHVHGSGSVPDGVSPDGRGHQRRLMATLALTGSVFVAEVVGAIVTVGIASMCIAVAMFGDPAFVAHMNDLAAP